MWVDTYSSHEFDGLSVPAAALALLVEDPDPAVWVSVGSRTEADLAAVAEHHGYDTAAAAVCLWRETRRAADAGTLGAAATLTTLVDVSQNTGRPRIDLRAEVAEMAQHPVLGLVTKQLLGPSPPDELVAVPAETDLSREGDLTVARVVLSAPAWPVVLGAAPPVNEQFRVFTLTARHAAWRDRAPRRLARLVVQSYQLWPEIPSA